MKLHHAVATLVLALTAGVLAEPPVSSHAFASAPAQDLQAPFGSGFETPSASYGAPPTYQPPSSSYGAPSQQYQAPRNQYLAPAPSSTYVPPSDTYGPPSQQYGPPSKPQDQYLPPVSSRYGSPSKNTHTAAIFKSQPPQSSYGAPSSSHSFSTSGSGASGYGSSGGDGGYGGYGEDAQYQFEYHVQDPPTALDFGHKEERQGRRVEGKYFVLLPDGRKQIVKYYADETGYHPTITYEETGAGGYGGGYPSGAGSRQQGGY